jgi:hypothetical protein
VLMGSVGEVQRSVASRHKNMHAVWEENVQGTLDTECWDMHMLGTNESADQIEICISDIHW